IWIFRLLPDKTLEPVTEIMSHEMPIDNLSVDRDGVLWGAGFPDALAFIRSTGDVLRRDSPTTVWRLRKGMEGEGRPTEGGWVIEKVVEDREAKVLGGATVAVHDVESGRIFTGGESCLSSVFSPYYLFTVSRMTELVEPKRSFLSFLRNVHADETLRRILAFASRSERIDFERHDKEERAAEVHGKKTVERCVRNNRVGEDDGERRQTAMACYPLAKLSRYAFPGPSKTPPGSILAG
ncbi:MAG: hypothetical protein LQ340_008066, partial [Diploschistes diacapsis]